MVARAITRAVAGGRRPVLTACWCVVAMLALPAAATAAPTADELALFRALHQGQRMIQSSPGASAAVDAPGLAWRGAVGGVTHSGPRLRARDVYRIASITKTFTAAATFRLVEKGRIRLDDPIARHLPARYVHELRREYDPSRITVRMLLAHTAGLFDYATTPAYTARSANDPGHRWTRLEQVRFAIDHGAPLSAPGTERHYSDTGYILLGQIIIGITAHSQVRAYRELLGLDRFDLRSTYWESLEPKPRGSGRFAHPYFGPLDAAGLDASADLYGGGGLVSTGRDLNRFYAALFAGRVISRASLRTMTARVTARDPGNSAMGLGRRLISGVRCYFHDGFWGSFTMACPARRVFVSVTVNTALIGAGEPSPELIATRMVHVALARR